MRIFTLIKSISMKTLIFIFSFSFFFGVNAQSDSIKILENKINSMYSQYFVLQSKIETINQDLKSYKSLNNDSLQQLMSKTGVLEKRLTNNENNISVHDQSIDIIAETQSTNQSLFSTFAIICIIVLLILAALLIYSFINTKKKIAAQHILLERLFKEQVNKIETEIRELSQNNKEKIKQVHSKIEDAQESAKADNKKTLLEIETIQKDLNKDIGIIKQKMTKIDTKFGDSDKKLQASILKNEKLIKDKTDKLKDYTKTELTKLLKTVNTNATEINTKVNDLKADVKKQLRSKKLSSRVKKSS